MMKETIKPEEWYTLIDVWNKRMIPWAKSRWMVKAIVDRDAKSEKVLNPSITGTGRGTKYHFKGSNIINFIHKAAAGDLRLGTNNKHNGTGKKARKV